MSLIVDQEGYQYASLVAATVFLLPQLRLTYKSRCARDLSTASLLFVVFGSFLWAFYMYENVMYLYATLTAFVGVQAIALILLQAYFYYQRVNEHMLTFDKPPLPPVFATVQQPAADAAV